MVKNTGYKATLANYPFKYADEQAKKYTHTSNTTHTHLFLMFSLTASSVFSPTCDISRIKLTCTDSRVLNNLPLIATHTKHFDISEATIQQHQTPKQKWCFLTIAAHIIIILSLTEGSRGSRTGDRSGRIVGRR